MEDNEQEQSVDWSARIRLVSTAGLPFVWGILLFIFMNATSPLQSGPLSVLAFFALAYLFMTSTLYATVLAFYKIASAFGMKQPLRRKMIYYLVSVIALGPVFMLALNTLGQLDVKEILLVIILLSLGCFYVARRGRRGVL